MSIIRVLILALLLSCNNVNKGGYAYEKPVSLQDSSFYFYPIRNLLSKRDSIYAAVFESRLFKVFNEPNISLGPLDNELYRFLYTGFSQPPVILILSDGNLTIKTAGADFEVFVQNDQALSDIEIRRLRFLKRRFPFDTATLDNSLIKQYVDSMIAAFPQPITADYISLLERNMPINSSFTYETRVIKLDKKTYHEIKAVIDSSGFWNSRYKIECDYPVTDGHSFYLEANTSDRYNFVITNACNSDTSKLTKACQKLVDIAGLKKQIQLVFRFTY